MNVKQLKKMLDQFDDNASVIGVYWNDCEKITTLEAIYTISINEGNVQLNLESFDNECLRQLENFD